VETVKQYCDPKVTQTKFEREIQTFVNLEEEWRKKGVFLVSNKFPVVEFIFVTAKLKPSSVAFSVRVDFSNFDIEPPSVKFIDPFTGIALTRKDVPVNFWQFKYPPQINNQLPLNMQVQQQDLLQGGPEMIPFLCIRGVREYHEHPYHTGDSWLLYRNTGVGNLNYLLDQLYNNSIALVNGHSISLTTSITGFNQFIPLPNQVS
jgi:hypothetical protein